MVQNVQFCCILDVSITTKLYTMKLLDEFNTAQKVAFLIITTVGAILIYVAATTNPTFIL